MDPQDQAVYQEIQVHKDLKVPVEHQDLLDRKDLKVLRANQAL
jgi:hypothetical protein